VGGQVVQAADVARPDEEEGVDRRRDAADEDETGELRRDVVVPEPVGDEVRHLPCALRTNAREVAEEVDGRGAAEQRRAGHRGPLGWSSRRAGPGSSTE
jgi:hypothetical protein